jgi:hypothetical protein
MMDSRTPGIQLKRATPAGGRYQVPADVCERASISKRRGYSGARSPRKAEETLAIHRPQVPPPPRTGFATTKSIELAFLVVWTI